MTRNAALRGLIAVSAIALGTSAAYADNSVAKSYYEFKKPKTTLIDGDLSLDTNGQSPTITNASSPFTIGFEGISQYNAAAFARNFIPPDTNGAVGKTQYMETTNGAYAIFDKITGVRQSLVSDVAFWAAAGQTGANGDSRVLYNAQANKWVAISFGANAKDLQIAVSATSNALGPWTSTKFQGYAGLGFGATADYPTLAMDRNAVYIGTNDFAPATSGGANSFRGTTLNVIPIASLFGGAAATTTGMKQFATPYSNSNPNNEDRGFALQGVNSSTASTSGTVVAASLFVYDTVAYKVNNLTPVSEAGATLGNVNYVGESAFQTAGPGRQPATIVANRRILAVSDERISSSVYEANGMIYMVHVVDSLTDSVDEARLHYMVLDATNFTILDEGDIGQAGYDYWEASIAVNRLGQVVIGFNRAGSDPVTGKIAFMAKTFNTGADGSLIATSAEIMLKESLTNDYHNGSVFGQAAAGRQRWGDYSQVSIDPTSSHGFYLIGEFAREYNNAAGGHPGGTGGSRWGTYIAALNLGGVPEPTTWALMIGGFGMVGGALRRQRRSGFATA